MLNRREFHKGLLVTAVAALLPSTACSVNVRGMITAVIESANALLKVYPNALLATVVAQLQTAVNNWVSGPVTAEIIEIVQDVSNVVAGIDPNSIIAVLLPVLVTAISLLIGALTPAQQAKVFAKVKVVSNPYVGKAVLRNADPHSRSFVSDYVTQWNDTALSHGLKAAVI